MKFYACFNYLGFELPEEAVKDCYHQGACDADVIYWQKKLNLNLDRLSMVLELREYGAWEEKELDNCTNNELEQKLIWIAAGNIQEEIDEEVKNA